MKESCMAQGSLELKPLLVLSTILCKTKDSLTRKKKKKEIRFITPSSKPAQPLAHLQNSLPQLRDNYSQQPWRRAGPLKTVAFYILACIYLVFS